MSRYVIGIDQSATGTAAVELDTIGDEVNRVVFYADNKRDSKELEEIGALPPRKVKAGDEQGVTQRLVELREVLGDFLQSSGNIMNAALEGYAFARQAFSHSLGEVGGLVRLALWDAGIPFRVYDPQAVKIFSAGKGNAKKHEVMEAVERKWGFQTSRFGKPDGAGGNVADAYVIARMLRAELLVRSGSLRLDEIPEEERRVFLRVTKQHPTNFLDLPFAGRKK